MKPTKPLGIKAYGSIGHLPGSRMGPGDHHIDPGQGKICTLKARDRHDSVIVQEKLDGSNVAVARLADGEIVPLIRAGYRAQDSPREQHQLFHQWAIKRRERFAALLQPGERVCGEWLLQAHGTRYDLAGREPFVAFDLMIKHRRALYADVQRRCAEVGITTAPTLHIGAPLSIEAALGLLGTYGRYGALEPIEGAVWRVERQGEVEFLAKYVRPDKIDGAYLSETIWNVALETLLAPV